MAPAEQLREGPPRVGVLGPTTIDGSALTARQRAIVAALALRAGTLTTPELIDAVWPEGTPRSARQSLQNQVTRLRRAFGAEVIVTEPTGYRLGAASDAGVFDATVSPLLDRPASPSAIAPLEMALGLWRGEPYLDLVEVWEVEPERARLQSLQASAAESLARCRIVAGELNRAVNELHALIGADPYRDERWLLLVLALHLDGRTGEALAAHDRLADLLAADLGAEPSPRMAELRNSIRSDDVDLGRWISAGRTPDRSCSSNRRLLGRCERVRSS